MFAMMKGRRLAAACMQIRQAASSSQLDLSSRVLSDLTVYSKYARFLPDLQRREAWPELVERNIQMHASRFPHMEAEIREHYANVHNHLVLPSMRSLQFAGPAIEANNSRVFNCSFLPLDDPRAFSEGMFLLLGGTGVGFSVQQHHVQKLPRVQRPQGDSQVFLIPDSCEGWADACHALMSSYLLPVDQNGQPSRPVRFDYSLVRPKGSPIRTAGGRAPGPEPLRTALMTVRKLLDAASGRKLTSLEAHDVFCHFAAAVASGGVRRSALISLFSPDDEDMITCKSGAWWENNGQRALANNSVVLSREETTESEFFHLWDMIKASNSGEPGIYFTQDVDWGTNPCCEIALEPFQFCNLTEINASMAHSQEALEALVRSAAFIGTLQASYTNFHYLRPIWKETTERGSLLGVSMTGIASGNVLNLDLSQAASEALRENERVANLLGISPADRVTTVKPAGTTSLVLGTSSGVHAWHSDYYIRRLRINKVEPLYAYLAAKLPELLEDDIMDPAHRAVIGFPQKAPSGAHLRTEPALDLLKRVHQLHDEWIKPGHRRGANTNNVSTTVSVKKNEWNAVGEWMWKHRDSYNGLCVLPYDEHTYQQAPFEDCSKEEYERLANELCSLDLKDISEFEDDTEFQLAAACAGQRCDITV